jgi:hypothetical protein
MHKKNYSISVVICKDVVKLCSIFSNNYQPAPAQMPFFLCTLMLQQNLPKTPCFLLKFFCYIFLDFLRKIRFNVHSLPVTLNTSFTISIIFTLLVFTAATHKSFFSAGVNISPVTPYPFSSCTNSKF